MVKKSKDHLHDGMIMEAYFFIFPKSGRIVNFSETLQGEWGWVGENEACASLFATPEAARDDFERYWAEQTRLALRIT